MTSVWGGGMHALVSIIQSVLVTREFKSEESYITKFLCLFIPYPLRSKLPRSVQNMAHHTKVCEPRPQFLILLLVAPFDSLASDQQIRKDWSELWQVVIKPSSHMILFLIKLQSVLWRARPLKITVPFQWKPNKPEQHRREWSGQRFRWSS